MKNSRFYLFLYSCFLFLAFNIQAQVGINNLLPQASLDIVAHNPLLPSSNSGIIIPKVNVFPTVNPSTSQHAMIVELIQPYLTFQPGYYYWHSTNGWLPFAGQSKDFFTVGSELAPDDINDDKYTLGQLVIGNQSPKGIFDINSSNRGVVFPRISISNMSQALPIINPSGDNVTNSTLIFNSDNSNNRGFNYWFNNRWNKLYDDGQGKPKFYIRQGINNATVTNSYTIMPEMSVTFTPKSDVCYIEFSASGFYANPENILMFSVRVNGILQKNFQATCEGVNTFPPIWDTSFKYPIQVNKDVSNLVEILWVRPNVAGGNINNVLNPLQLSTNFFYNANRTLVVTDPNGGIGNDDAPILFPTNFKHWRLTGNNFYNNIIKLGSLDNQDIVIKTNNISRFLISNQGNLGASQLGTALFPNYSFETDSDTGMYLSSFNNLGLSTGGTDRIRFNNLGRVGLSVTNPRDELHLVGSLRMVDGNQANGRYMVSDENGTGSWRSITPSNDWLILGNNIYNDEVNYIGSSNNADIRFRRNNIFSGSLGSLNTTFGLNTTFVSFYNTSYGVGAIQNNISGLDNSAFGYQALNANESGSYNSAYGRASLLLNVNGASNSAYGYQSLRNNISGNDNTAMGRQTLFSNSTGFSNTSVGRLALYSNLTGNSNSAIGFQALYGGTIYENSTALGVNTVISANNQIRLGSNTVTSIGGFVGFTNLSDSRFKVNVNEDVQGLNFIKKLNPVTYNFDIKLINNHLRKTSFEVDEIISENTQSYSGFIAQEVEQVANELGYNFSGIDKPKSYEDTYGLRYEEFVVPIVKAVQEQQVVLSEQHLKLIKLKLIIYSKYEELKTLKTKLK